MGLGQVEDLLHRLAQADAEQSARSQGDLPLDRLEAGPAGVRPGVEEGGQPGAAIGLDQREQRHHGDGGSGDSHQGAERHAAGDQERGDREGDDQGRAEVGLGADQHAGQPDHEQKRAGDPAQAP